MTDPNDENIPVLWDVKLAVLLHINMDVLIRGGIVSAPVQYIVGHNIQYKYRTCFFTAMSTEGIYYTCILIISLEFIYSN